MKEIDEFIRLIKSYAWDMLFFRITLVAFLIMILLAWLMIS